MKSVYDDLSLAELDEIVRLQRKHPLGWVLSQIGGWHVGCQNAEERASEVDECDARGLIGRRTHYAPMIQEGVSAFELTDAGLAQLKEWCGDEVAMYAEKSRAWYRASALKHQRST